MNIKTAAEDKPSSIAALSLGGNIELCFIFLHRSIALLHSIIQMFSQHFLLSCINPHFTDSSLPFFFTNLNSPNLLRRTHSYTGPLNTLCLHFLSISAATAAFMCASLGNCDVCLQAIPDSSAKFSYRLMSTAAAGYS